MSEIESIIRDASAVLSGVAIDEKGQEDFHSLLQELQEKYGTGDPKEMIEKAGVPESINIFCRLAGIGVDSEIRRLVKVKEKPFVGANGIKWEESGIPEDVLNKKCSSGLTVREAIEGARNQIFNANRLERAVIAMNSEWVRPIVDQINSDEDTLLEIAEANSEHRVEIAQRSPRAAELVVWVYEIEAKREKAKQQTIRRSSSAPIIYGGVAPRREGSLHTSTIMEEIHKPRPTTPFFQNTDQGGRWVDPLEPYMDFSHDIPQMVDPRKPPYHNPTQGG